MNRSGKRKNAYSVDVYRYSIYPKIKYESHDDDIRIGQQLVLDIYDIDDKGRGVVVYKGKKVIIPNAMLGSRVRVKIVRIERDYAVAHIVNVIRETDSLY